MEDKIMKNMLTPIGLFLLVVLPLTANDQSALVVPLCQIYINKGNASKGNAYTKAVLIHVDMKLYLD